MKNKTLTNAVLKQQINRFIKGGFKKSQFTNNIYEMLYIYSNRFIAHFNKEGFYKIRFENEALETLKSLRDVSSTNKFKTLCELLADGMEESILCRTTTSFHTSVVSK